VDVVERSTPAAGSFAAWVMAARPATLGAAFAPVAIGAACAWAAGGLRWPPTLAALAAAFLIQIGTNFANDVFDFEKGADTGERLGPTRAVQAGLLTPRQMRWGMAVAFGLAFLLGLYLTWVGGWPLLVIGVASILSGIAYTGGPYPLGYNGLGDIFAFIFFGLVAVCGTVLLNLGHVTQLAWAAAVPPGALITAILVVNNVRDRGTDARAGKRTLAVRWGRRAVLVEYWLLLAAAYAVPVALWLRGTLGPWTLLPWLTLPLALFLAREIGRREGRALNPVLVSTAKLVTFFGLFFALGIILGAPPF
jgi:1,4-dihydroxy-2-naphthoate octaprenyltransferase